MYGSIFLSKGLVPVLHEFIGKAIYNKPPIFWMVYTKHFMVKFGMADPMVLPTFVHWSIAPWGLLNDLTIVWWGVPKSANPGMSYKLHMCLPLKQIKRLIYADTTHTHKDHIKKKSSEFWSHFCRSKYAVGQKLRPSSSWAQLIHGFHGCFS